MGSAVRHKEVRRRISTLKLGDVGEGVLDGREMPRAAVDHHGECVAPDRRGDDRDTGDFEAGEDRYEGRGVDLAGRDEGCRVAAVDDGDVADAEQAVPVGVGDGVVAADRHPDSPRRARPRRDVGGVAAERVGDGVGVGVDVEDVRGGAVVERAGSERLVKERAFTERLAGRLGDR